MRKIPTVLIFGSLTSPQFRQRAKDINELRRELGSNGQVIVIYTREAHAAGEWEVERNRDEKISLSQPETLDARRAAARKTAKSLDLSVPIWIDSMDDATLLAYGNHPNAAVLIGRDGKIAAYQNAGSTRTRCGG
jgi:hypothetical protein